MRKRVHPTTPWRSPWGRIIEAGASGSIEAEVSGREDCHGRFQPRSGGAHARAHERVGPQRGRLRDATVAFRAAVEAPSIEGAEGNHDWCTAVAKSLAELQDAWLAHVRFTEDEDGLFEELVEDNPEAAASEVDHLRRDHVVVASAMARAGELLGADGAGPAEAKLRDCAEGGREAGRRPPQAGRRPALQRLQRRSHRRRLSPS